VASALAYLSGYLLEYALSVDNLFVMLLVFQSFKISHKNEQRILIWGVLGAMVLRFIFIYIGSAAIQRFHWILFVFGGLLIYSGIKLLLESSDKEFDPENHGIMKWVKKFIPVTQLTDDKTHFFVRIDGKLHATVLFVVLLIVEFTDVVFAIDSVPAVFGITTDTYILFFSNILNKHDSLYHYKVYLNLNYNI
jgi:tellurite resistance protein TerC